MAVRTAADGPGVPRPEGMAMVQFDTADLRRFLGRSYAIVPEGSEAGELDLDQGLASLLRDA
ncbi:hypothetical protein SSPO_025610 [Streptomyces antimycoticus]|uniref:Uncharacterized protein n=1 Tax=Streptomyces antimycoticus TaxID=68175 RepID=A0A499UEY0_9ACTN|nr:hypothetical protein SSPO_025610 [Streptomyces antimycoticus]